MTQDEALKLALEWLDTDDSQKIKMAKHFIEQALAQPVSSHGNAEDLYVEMSKHLNCSHCGGSGHIDDVAQPEQTNIARHEANVQKFLSAPQPEQEPMAWGVDWGKAGDIPCVSIIKRVPNGGIEVMAVEYAPYSYTTPPQRKPLTDEQLKPLIQKAMMYYGHNPDHWLVTAGAGFCILARAIEAAHGIKE